MKKRKILNFNKKNNQGITLVTLVITIIVLIILATISIGVLGGENGIIKKSKYAKEQTEIAEEIDILKLCTALAMGEDPDGNLTETNLRNELDKNIKNYTLEAKNNKFKVTFESGRAYIVDVNGNIIENADGLDESKSYVGYYADIDGDKVVDGIIYADLAVGGSGTWNNDSECNYEYAQVTEGLKSYIISSESYTGFNGKWTQPVITTVNGSTGADRFYVMALEDFNPGTQYCWYDAAEGKLDNPISTNINDFGQGKANTKIMIEKWNNGIYGSQHDNGTYKDMWGEIQTEVGDTKNPTWFVPSKAELAAFGDFVWTKMGVNNNYSDYGFNMFYWSSAHFNTFTAYGAYFSRGYFFSDYVSNGIYVRLSTTF